MVAHRFLCLGDNHGDAESLRRVVEDTADESFDYVVHTGDFTNMFFDGYPSAQESLDKIVPHLETLAEDSELVYVYGNRDARGPDRLTPGDIPVGTHVPEGEVIEIGDLAFSQQPPTTDTIDTPVVRVTHFWLATPPKYDGLLSLSGDTHDGRAIGNIVDTGFLYRTGDHGADAVYGCYAVVEIDEDGEVDVQFRPIGGVDVRTCSRHELLGDQFVVPEYWNESCHYCYEEEEYVEELRSAVVAAYMNSAEDDTDVNSSEPEPTVTEDMIDVVEDSFPRPFRPKERTALVNKDEKDSEQTGLSDF